MRYKIKINKVHDVVQFAFVLRRHLQSSLKTKVALDLARQPTPFYYEYNGLEDLNEHQFSKAKMLEQIADVTYEQFETVQDLEERRKEEMLHTANQWYQQLLPKERLYVDLLSSQYVCGGMA